ncbi:MAG: tRNA (adenosine(37)-N6)-threonylcarbamoyltransferase complex transferase subunit TsaD [Ignavibacteria bacterium]|jgi:N6-L-threonylcarbamoyladenine synthase
MIYLGIESSCDETSVAVVSENKVLANLVSSQDFHKEYGGVVPELSSRAHLEIILPLVKQALKKASIILNDIDVICATAGPGLIGALLVGLTFAKGLSLSLNKPFIPVNHIEGHIFSGFLMKEKPEFPFLCLVVSGGHTLLLNVKSESEIYKLGSTIDDAAGEAFDKVAKMLGLEYPGGPSIQKYAAQGDENKIRFPISQCKNIFDFSFSGLKTAVLRYIQKEYGSSKEIDKKQLPDIAASFQKAVVGALKQKTEKALFLNEYKTISLVGGVAANQSLRKTFQELSAKHNVKLVIPDLQFCGDNAAMIANRGMQLNELGRKYSLSYNAYASIPPETFL